MQKKKRIPSFTDVLRRKRRSAGAVFISLFLWAFLWAQEQGDGLRPDSNDLVTASDGYVSAPLHSNLYTHTSEWIVNPFDQIPQPLFGMDSVSSLRGVFDVRYDGFERWAEVSYDWSVIVIYEAHEGLLFKIPFAAPMDWYFQQRITQNRYANFYEVMKRESKEKKKQRGQKIEVFGLDTGAGRVSLNISGNITITGKMVFQDQELARSSFREAQTTHFEFDERQQLRSEGKIGDRVSVFLDWDSERDFDWENNIRIHYFGKEDEIIQKIEAGNISLSLPSTQFVSFSGNSKGLFGIKSIMKLGPVDITSIMSIEQTRKEKKKFKGGTESQGQAILDYRYRKNQYFFIDQVFRDGGSVLDNDGIVQFHSQNPDALLGMPSFYPLDELGRHLLGNVVVSEIEVFKGVGAAAGSGTFYGLTYVDPVFKNGRWKDRNPENADTTNNGFFRRLVRNVDYFVSEDLGFIRLTTPAQIEKIAVSYQLSERKVVEQDTTKIIKNVGELTFDIEEGDTIHLKLIKPDDPRPSHPTWPLAFKNVYYLGTSNINKEGFTLEIIYKNGVLGDDIYDEDGNTFLNLFGLDNFDENGALNPDDLMDLGNPNILSLISGELIFPMLHPFEMDSLVYVMDKPTPDDPLYRGEGNLNTALKKILPDSALMYRGTVDQQIRNESKFDIRVTYTNTSSTINLGGFMLVEGSEEVRLNNVLLQKDKDYVIDYFSGTLTFLADAINDPSADLEILYEKHELVSFDKKTIVGARAQMDLGKKSFIGMTALFYNQSVINEKIEVGYEPTKNFIWDINGRYESEINLLTQAIDKLPLIETTKPSLFTIEGEYAQVLPNPNPINNESTGDRNGVAYIDDFEGAKRTTSPSINQRFWNRSSVPVGMDPTHRAQFFWYNPFTQYRTRDIWPNLDTGIRAGNELTDILRLNYKRRDGVLRDSSWAGITTSFYTSDYNQTGSKFFEIWLLGDEGKITVDLGFISEDQNNNNIFDTEDKPESGLFIGNTLLEEEEDIGLDGCENDYEDGYGGCLPNGFTYENAPDSIKYTGNDVNPDDPNEDNWYFNQNDVERPRKYRFLNGTERNGYPPAGLNPLEGALYPDTEDINRNGTFDVRDDYLTFTFDLSETSDDWFNYQGGLTETGWRLYRIPLAAFQKARDGGDITWDTIKFMRLVVSGIEDSAEVWIAKLEMVGNEWQELGVRANLAEDYVVDDSVFAITVVNTDDNLEYAQSVEEIGVQGEYDRLNEVRLKEQSLVLKFTDLGPGEEGAAQKNLFELRGEQAQSYLTYKKLKLFTYGKNKEGLTPHIWSDSSDVEFFIRFGRADDYYELRQPVYRGWDSKLKRNFIEIDLDFLTEIKVLNPEKIELPPNHIFTASDNTKEYIITSEGGVDTLKRYYIQGAPSLSRLQYFIVGVKNTHPDSSISGEVWIDELRLSGVRKDVGTAFRVQSKLQFADVGNVTVSYNRKDADFHVLQKRLGSGRTSEKFRIDSRISIDKLFPQQWGLKLPLSMGFTNNVTTPKYIPGSDIRLNEDAIPDSVLEKMLTTSKQMSLTTSLSKSTKSDHWYTRYSIDRIKLNFSGSRGLESNEQTARRFTRNYTGGTSYNLPFGRDNYVSPLKFLKSIPWLGEKVGKTHLYYTPSSIDLSANVSETITETTPRVGDYKEIYNMGLSRNFKVNYTILENLKTNYNKNIKSDMNQFRARHLDAVKNLKPGVVSGVTENLTTTFNPTILSWLKPSLNYSSNYRWSKPKDSTQEGATIQSQRRFSSSITLTLKSIIETVYTPPRKSRSTRRRGKTRVPDEQEKKKKKPPNEGIKTILKGIYAAVSRVNPINITYSENQSQNAYQVLGSPDLTYRFGFSDELGLDHSEDAGVNRGSKNFQYDFSIRSGLKLIKQVSTNFNFSNNRSLSIDGNNIQTKSETRDYFPKGVKGDKGFPIAGWNVRITGVEKWPLINLLSKSATFEHAFVGKESRSWQNNSIQSSKYTSSYSPLAGFSMTLVKNISLSTRYSIVNSVDNRFGGINSTRLKKDRTFTASTNYTHRGGLRIPIVFFRDFNLENTINFTLSLDFSDSKTKERNKEGVKLTTTGEQKSWKISPRISYSFTRRVTGGIWYEYRESESKVIGKKIDRDFGFEVNIAIQG